jgi:alkaline phosphatase
MKANTLFGMNTLIITLLISCFQGDYNEDKILKPKNIILMIGDGMGLSQITAAMYSNEGGLNLEEIEHIGLIKTNSASSIITDSAAGATAYSTGKKTYNGSINMNIDTLPLIPITVNLYNNNIKTGIVSSCSVTHATPACFYGNMKHRYDDNEVLAKQFITSNINVLMGGGEDYFTNRKDNINLIDTLKSMNYTVIDSIIDDIDADIEYLINFCAPKHPKSILNGRGEFLPLASEKSIQVLNTNNQNGFFLMIEGAQIDWGGHENDSEYIISETIDFDNALKKVLDFAKKDKETLVLITADHETGGYGIIGGDVNTHTIDGDFLITEHTATMVPIFAFGPGSENYTGIYHNNTLYNKILSSFNIK